MRRFTFKFAGYRRCVAGARGFFRIDLRPLNRLGTFCGLAPPEDAAMALTWSAALPYLCLLPAAAGRRCRRRMRGTPPRLLASAPLIRPSATFSPPAAGGEGEVV